MMSFNTVSKRILASGLALATLATAACSNIGRSTAPALSNVGPAPSSEAAHTDSPVPAKKVSSTEIKTGGLSKKAALTGNWTSDKIRLADRDINYEIQFRKGRILFTKNCDFGMDLDGQTKENFARIDMDKYSISEEAIDVKVAYRDTAKYYYNETITLTCQELIKSGLKNYTVEGDILTIENLYNEGESVIFRRNSGLN